MNYSMLPDNLQEGIRLLKKYGFVKDYNSTHIIKASEGRGICIEKDENEIRITYDTEAHFYMAFARSVSLSNGIHTINPRLKNLGLMLDCSRNAVARPNTVKRIICLMALFGYNYLQLYTEDTYELPNEPYFGYMRGRYTTEEWKEMIEFARCFGIEVVPCIQTLAHFTNLRQWKTYADFMDIDDVLLVGDERTYALIQKSIHYCKEVFQTKRINIGTDEAFRLGRGRYTDRYGYREKHDIYLDHLERVFAICQEEGVEPEFWGDALYMQDGFDKFGNTSAERKRMTKIFEGTKTPIYWEYSSTDKEYHSSCIHKLKEYSTKVIYAGGLWNWVGFAPFNVHSKKVIDAAFPTAIENGVDDIIMTVWGDNGAESSPFMIIPSMFYAAHTVFPCELEADELLYNITGYSEKEWLLSDQMNTVTPESEMTSNAAKYLLYNDFFIGLMNYHIPMHADEIYKGLTIKFEQLKERDSQFAYLFACLAQLCNLLSMKATFGNRLCDAYKKKDEKQLKELVGELPKIKQELELFHSELRRRWFHENKGFGFEVLDIRIGGLIARIDTITERILTYLEGRLERIDELEEERMALLQTGSNTDEIYAPYQNDWKKIYTVNVI